MTRSPEPAPPRATVDAGRPHSARMYDWWLGGKDNFAADRQLGEQFARAIPGIRAMARANRRFLERAVTALAREHGIRQYLDIGTGIPTTPNVHQVAQSIAPDARVVYVDNDPIVLTHARALLVSHPDGRVGYVPGDLRNPQAILAHPRVRATIDLHQPIGLLLIAVLMLVADADDPYGNTRILLDAMPPGSWVALTHPGTDFNPPAMARVVDAATTAGMTLVPRTRAGVGRFFHGWDLADPGVVPVKAWRSDTPADGSEPAYYWAGLARKPTPATATAAGACDVRSED